MFRRKIYGLFLGILCLVLTGCTFENQITGKKQFQATFLELFDTVTAIIGFADSEEEFQKTADAIRSELERYHQLFDIYNEYEGVNNLKTINDNAGISPVKVDPIIIELLSDCKEYYEKTNGTVNVAMGSVLKLWHEEREKGINDPTNAALPLEEDLAEAAKHCSMDTLIINKEDSTVYIADPMQRLDVGAIAKGWATQKVCENAPSGILVSVGGNVCSTGPKPVKEGTWVVGIESPFEGKEEYLHTLYINRESVVTSGNYQRYYTVEGKRYHHLIDPDTLYPSEKFISVTIVCEDSGLADALSTALYLLPMEEGQKLLEEYDAKAVWVVSENEIYYSEGFEELIRS